MPPNIATPVTLRARLRASVRRRVAPPIVVLAYHRVAPHAGRDPNRLVTCPANFTAQLSWLSRNACVLRTRQFVNAVAHPSRGLFSFDGGRPRVLITFDDGYADNLHHGLPILQRHGCEAIVFATSGLIGSGELFWWDALEQTVFSNASTVEGWQLPDGTQVPAVDDPQRAYELLHAALKSLGDGDRPAALAGLTRQGAASDPADVDARPMTWDELRAWVQAGMAVGGHTRTHPILSRLEASALHDETAGCKQELEDNLGLSVGTFAYPYGSRDTFDERCEKAVRDAGFRCAFANRSGNVRWARSPYALPRYLVRDWSADEFASRFQEWCR